MKSRIFALTALALVMAGTAPQLVADTIAKIDGIAITDELYSMFAKGRTGKSIEELSDVEKERLTDELYKMAAVGAEARKRKLNLDPEISAQLKLQELSVLAQALVGRYLEDNPVTDEQVKSLYDTKYGSGGNQTEYKARHILVPSPSTATDLIGQLNGGANFADLATQNSIGPSAQKGGDLGWFTRDTMVPEFADAVAAMETGSYSERPVQTQFGWHVILKEEERLVPPPDISAVGTDLQREIQQESIDKLVNGLRDKAKVKTYK